MKSLFQDRPPDDRKRPLVIAHRGASGLAPENTMAAFRLAAALGADGVELDVRLSRDRRAVVMHDARVNRTTAGRGLVRNLTAEQICSLEAGRWFERRLTARPRAKATIEKAFALAGDFRGTFSGEMYSGETVPALEAVLAFLAQARLRRIYVELKDRAANNEPLLEQVVALAKQFQLEDSITLLSFDHSIIRLAKRSYPGIRAAATFPFAGARLATAGAITRALEEIGAEEAALHFGLVTKRAVERLIEKEFSVSVWTANNRVMMRRLIGCGVDSIMTNFPDRLIEVINSPRRFSNRRNGRERA